MIRSQRFNAHGGGGGGAGSRLPKFAEDIAGLLFRDTQDNFSRQGGQFGPGGTGIFGDIAAGYNAGDAAQLFSGLLSGVGGGQMGRDYFGRNAINLTDRGIANGMELNDWGKEGAQDSRDYNRLNDKFLEQSSGGYNKLMGLLGQSGASIIGGPGSQPSLRQGYGVGTTGAAALASAKDTGPDSQLYKDTLALLTPQTRAAYSARGLGLSGQAANAEADQARQLADSFAQRANQEKNAFYQTAANSEGTAAGFGGAYNNALANMYGTRLGSLSSIYGNQLQGATAATEAPGRVFSTFQGGIGQGIQNIGAALGQYLQPMQMNQAGLAGLGQALNLPLSYQQSLYNYLRSPQTQLLGVPSSTGQQSNGSHPNGLLGDMLGFEKGG